MKFLCNPNRFDPVSAGSLLDDKSHLEGTRERYRAFEVETPWDYTSEELAARAEFEGEGSSLIVVPQVMAGFDALYNDEYDDTYDSHSVGAADDSTDEQFTVQRLAQPNYKVQCRSFLVISD